MLMTIQEVAELTRVSQSTIDRLIGAEKFPRPRKIQRRSVWRRTDIERWAARLH